MERRGAMQREKPRFEVIPKYLRIFPGLLKNSGCPAIAADQKILGKRA
jgi:hypothetical protein